MQTSRVTAEHIGAPFPVYKDLTHTLLASAPEERDPTLAHVLAVCAGYAYADAGTVAMMMARLGLEACANVQLTQVVDAMYIHSCAHLVQSRCGRVVILGYRGTELASISNWMGNLDVGSQSLRLVTGAAIETPRVHGGFYRNFQATRWAVEQELQAALQGRSLADHGTQLAHPMQALFVTGHSLGASMAELFALSLSDSTEHAQIASRLRAVYTYGGPMTIGEPFPVRAAARVGARLYRHVMPGDPVPALPPASWGQFVHLGHEFRYADGRWQRADSPVTPLVRVAEIPKSLLAMFAGEKRRTSLRYASTRHGPHHYLAALRPAGRVSEFGDFASGPA